MQIGLLDILIRLFLSATLGGLIGLERQIQGQKAGFRTQLIVCLGSALYTISSIKFYENFNLVSDPARIAAQIVVGIGFLGAGAIVKYRNHVRGLTTAATLWVVSAVGVSVGLGEYIIATVTTFIVLMNLIFLKKLEGVLPADIYSKVIITTSLDNPIKIEELLKSQKISLQDYRENYFIDEKRYELRMTISYKKKEDINNLINFLKEKEGIIKICVD